MAAPTVQAIASALLRMLGVNSLFTTTGENPIMDGDLDDVAMVMTQAYQEIFNKGPGEIKSRPMFGVLNAPTAVTLSATNGSAVISGFTTWATWMPGSTVRINGDTQDNELLSATLLARPYMGTTASGLGATVYGDCLTLDDTVEKVVQPMLLGNNQEIFETQSRQEFIFRGGWSNRQSLPGTPYYYLGAKPSGGFPTVFFIEGVYDSTLDYVPRRIRFSPMPMTQLSVSYIADMTAPRITAVDILNSNYSPTSNTKIPTINGSVESVFLPIAMQILTRLPTFKNSDSKPEIMRQYQDALRRLTGSRASVGSVRGNYV